MKRLLFLLCLIPVFGVAAYAQSTPPENPKYKQFKGQASAPANPPSGSYRMYVDNTGAVKIVNSSGVATAVGGSYDKLTQSGTNNGTLTLYDDTASTGKSILVLRDGAGQAQVPSLQFFDSAGNFKSSLSYDGLNLVASRSASNYNLTDNFLAYRLRVGDNGTISGEFAHDTTSLSLSSTFKINWANGTGYNDTKDIGLARASAGVLKVTDGSSGNGSLAVYGNINLSTSGEYIRSVAGNRIGLGTNSTEWVQAFNGGLDIYETGQLWFSTFGGTSTVGLTKASAGVLKVTDGSSGYGVLDIAKVQGWQTKTLTESAATGFVDIALAQNTVVGGFVEYVVRTTNGTDYSVESGQLFFTGASKTNGTVDDADVGLVGTPVQSTTAANTFTNQFTATKGTNKITLNCQSDSTLTSTDTITLFYRVHLNGAQTETITGL